MASQLVKLGANPSAVANAIYSNRTLGEINLLKSALNRMKLLKDGKAIITYLTKEDFERYGKELDDLASFFRDVEGVMLSILVKELDYDHISVSLRSKPPYPCLPFAKEFRGGGHAYACGFKGSFSILRRGLKAFRGKISQLELGR
jgi:phosphoesterase RecJ-like protein